MNRAWHGIEFPKQWEGKWKGGQWVIPKACVGDPKPWPEGGHLSMGCPPLSLWKFWKTIIHLTPPLQKQKKKVCNLNQSEPPSFPPFNPWPMDPCPSFQTAPYGPFAPTVQLSKQMGTPPRKHPTMLTPFYISPHGNGWWLPPVIFPPALLLHSCIPIISPSPQQYFLLKKMYQMIRLKVVSARHLF